MPGREEEIIEQLRCELGVCEDTEHLIDWLLDAWATMTMLRERFGEARARDLYTTPIGAPQINERDKTLVSV